ncbi:1-pyrroline-5-carboxylate dehydrogenase 1 [bioreactor metagenome]|uniref:L-glutamate gamma-semialdehyde dehydrogenase n=1 Tax=bioreactor metagenome TaxID=1076179 RepID=A0A644W3R3_9ZZZZ
MNNSFFMFREPENEPLLGFAPGTPEKRSLKAALAKVRSEVPEIPLIIGGREYGSEEKGRVVMPHDHGHVLATHCKASPADVERAVKEAARAKKEWENTPWTERAAVMLKIAELFTTEYRDLLLASTMLGQSKNVFQAQIDAVAEAADFIRFNVAYASSIYAEQPRLDRDSLNRMEYRPLEGFVFAVTPFNFTAIASNLVLAPVLMGNTVLWKPAGTSLLSSYYLMKIYEKAGLPAGVVNFLPGSGEMISRVVTKHPDLAGIHFTGSTDVFSKLWMQCAENLRNYRSFPRLVGETGGKNFLVVHPTADVDAAVTAMVRGAFEYQGQKCSAVSRCYIPKSLREKILSLAGRMIADMKTGSPEDFRNFINAVIDEASFDNCMKYISAARMSTEADILFGGRGDKSAGYFVEPTVIETTDPEFVTMREEIFGPVLTLYTYEDDRFGEILELCDRSSPYGLTGAVFAADRKALALAARKLKYAAGNFYVNDKPTGAVVGKQPFGGSRASGTNDKAGSRLNLLRWTSPLTVKENLRPPRWYAYPFMDEE